ncbi:TRAP transporter substrate-binding protein [Thalassospira sp. ER-Se-21-Dark]|uniref:TRAP transporter substrate-binding protein n=1 Tax=Thalassospira sp. ER-Se-21-Dark TaxID=2585190 RepID=UPI001B3119CC|nr:TRAP transporter substrate-binding protein [Thalassospira sp. ER-Se-21-Dark]MBP3124829.1 TRAP transporter substrate-binding protein [Thalassospira sp. ER-Se-21-Dark]
MGKISNLVTAAMITLAMSSGSAMADSWRMTSKMPADSPEGKVFQKFADLTEKYTDGNLTIEVYPNEQLGKEDAVLEQLQMGIINIYAEGFGYMKKWAPELVWTAAPFMFDDFDHWARFMDSDLVKSWFAKVEDAAGVAPLGSPTRVLRGPFRVIVSNTPVNGLKDIDRLKLRMHPNKLAIASWEHLGAEVITLPWTEVYQSIQKDIVQAVNSPIALVQSMRFNEVAPYIGRTDEYWQSIGFMMNVDAYEALDEATKAGLLKAYNEAGDYSRDIMNEVAQQSIDDMVASGATYVELDTAPFVQSMKSFYAEMASTGELPDGFIDAVEAARSE